MKMKHTLIIAALTAAVGLLMIAGLHNAEADESTNGQMMDTHIYMAGDNTTGLDLWPAAPVDDSMSETITTSVSDQYGQGYTDVGTWQHPLDKSLKVNGQADFSLYVNSDRDDGPQVRFRITMLGVQAETGWVSTNKEIVKVTATANINSFVAKGSNLTMQIEVDEQDKTLPPYSDKNVILHYFGTSYPAGVEFPSNATDIHMDLNLTQDGNGVNYYEVLVNISDSFGSRHIREHSFIMNVTSVDDPVNLTWEDKRDGNESNASDIIKWKGTEYLSTEHITQVTYNWYYEGQTYSDGTVGAGVEPGDYWFNFTMMDQENNTKYYRHKETGVRPTHVSMNLHTSDSYIHIEDENHHTVNEVAVGDKVFVVVYVEVNRGDRDYTYNVVVQLKDNGENLEKRYIEMKGKEGEKIYFNWTPTQGHHVLQGILDPDNLYSETDESDNNATMELDVISNATPGAIISHPKDGSYINENIYILFDASKSTNPLGGEMTYTWQIYKDGDLKDTLNGDKIYATKLYGDSYGYGEYTVKLTVDNGKRTNFTTSTFYINALPHLTVDSPENNKVYTSTQPVHFSASATDADDSTLYFLWTSDIDGILNKNGGDVDYSMSDFSKTLSRGTHHITVKVTDYDPENPLSNGKRGEAVKEFSIVVNTPPEIVVTTPKEGGHYSSTSPVDFDASQTRDEDEDSMTFAWYDGRVYLSSQPKFNETLDAGSHEIKLEVSDPYSTSVKTINITVSAPPIANAGPSETVKLKDGKATAKLDASGSQPSDPSVPIVKYIWDKDASVDSDGDGIADNDADYVVTTPQVDIVYTKTGTYTVTLVVEDSAGVRSNKATTTVKVEKESSSGFIPGFETVLLISAISISVLGAALYRRR